MSSPPLHSSLHLSLLLSREAIRCSCKAITLFLSLSLFSLFALVSGQYTPRSLLFSPSISLSLFISLFLFYSSSLPSSHPSTIFFPSVSPSLHLNFSIPRTTTERDSSNAFPL
ncbi:hypothetical protein ILYODFUR_013681 [Ilyodon furcidens]|uniref:Transmembrane protein n=1 Tax=Ilyodon furcidens TaxID=33524 RepID=A0ABV0V2T5_9TELE